MNEDGKQHYFCRSHKPTPIPNGYTALPNLLPAACEVCDAVADVEIGPKPLKYPRLTTT